MRIDEFSAAADMDGLMTATEITRFMSVGFDVPIVSHAAPTPSRGEDRRWILVIFEDIIGTFSL